MVSLEHKSINKYQYCFDVKVEFPNLENLTKAYLWGLLDDEWEVLLLDNKKDALVLEQDTKVTGKEAYKRYSFLSDDDCLFYLQY